MDDVTRITVLVDNAEVAGLCSEWGLSLAIKHGQTNLLLDFGQSDAFAQNAHSLGIDLSTVDVAVLSHAHYDHADGMAAFFAHNDHAPLWLSAACAEVCWSTKGQTDEPHYIGILPGTLERFADRLRRAPIDRVTTIAPGVHLVPHTTPGLARKGEQDGMLLRMGDQWVPDDFAHEMSLVLEQPGGDLVICNSCSHAGLGTIANEVHAAFPGKAIRAFVGGLHLFRSSDEDVLRVAQQIRAAGIQQVYAGHCTGDRALALLRRELPGRVYDLSAVNAWQW